MQVHVITKVVRYGYALSGLKSVYVLAPVTPSGPHRHGSILAQTQPVALFRLS
jgi:hypothetical protein